MAYRASIVESSYSPKSVLSIRFVDFLQIFGTESWKLAKTGTGFDKPRGNRVHLWKRSVIGMRWIEAAVETSSERIDALCEQLPTWGCTAWFIEDVGGL
jgi:hypothetical protein